MPAIEFEKDTLGHILQARPGLRVPINQRSYAWEDEHVQDLLIDLNAAITAGADEYFLGSVIVVNTPDQNAIQVFDGQQRLATTMVLIGAIRDFICDILTDRAEAETITRQSLISVKRRGIETPHLILSLDDREFFEKRILRLPDHAERRAVRPNSKKQSHARIEGRPKSPLSTS